MLIENYVVRIRGINLKDAFDIEVWEKKEDLDRVISVIMSCKRKKNDIKRS